MELHTHGEGFARAGGSRSYEDGYRHPLEFWQGFSLRDQKIVCIFPTHSPANGTSIDKECQRVQKRIHVSTRIDSRIYHQPFQRVTAHQVAQGIAHHPGYARRVKATQRHPSNPCALDHLSLNQSTLKVNCGARNRNLPFCAIHRSHSQDHLSPCLADDG